MNSAQKQTSLFATAQNLNAQFTVQAGWQVANSYSSVQDELRAAERKVALADMSQVDKIQVEGDHAAAVLAAAFSLPDLKIGQVHEISETTAVSRLRRDQFLVMVMAGLGGKTITTLQNAIAEQAELVTVSNITHGRSVLAIFGPYGDELMSKLCALDFHPDQFPNMTAKQSSVAKTRQTIIRHDTNGTQTYLLVGGRSLTAYLWGIIMEAGAEYGITAVGTAAIQALATS